MCATMRETPIPIRVQERRRRRASRDTSPANRIPPWRPRCYHKHRGLSARSPRRLLTRLRFRARFFFSLHNSVGAGLLFYFLGGLCVCARVKSAGKECAVCKILLFLLSSHGFSFADSTAAVGGVIVSRPRKKKESNDHQARGKPTGNRISGSPGQRCCDKLAISALFIGDRGMRLSGRGKRQSRRCSALEHRRGKDIVGPYATKYPDYTYLSDDLSPSDDVPTFCVEIKPKQAHLCRTDRILQKCPYCLTQYYKKQNGSTKRISDYCPFDLFSGEATRMDRALCALLRSPQNNLKIFKNGSIIYDESTADRDETSLQRVLDEELQMETEVLLKLLRCALARPFDVDGGERRIEDVDEGEEEREMMAPKRLDGRLVERARTLLELTKQVCDTSTTTQTLVVGSVLERILRMQRLHRRGADVVAWMHASLGTMLRDSAVYGELEDAREVEGLNDYAVQDKAISVEKDVLKYYSLEECYETLRNYLLFCTAKDCSILIAFQRIGKDSTIPQHSINRIDVSKDQRFLVSVRILDLDMKKLQCIEKHRRRDNDVLQATIKELEKQLGL